MKLDEIREEGEGDELLYPGEDETDESVNNLTEALTLLDDCNILLDTLSDPEINAGWKKTQKFLRHNLLKVKGEVQELLDQYDMASISQGE